MIFISPCTKKKCYKITSLHPKIKLKSNNNYIKKKLMLMIARKFTNYRPHMAGITQNKQKCLIFIVVPQGRKKNLILIRLDQNGEKIRLKNK